ncbi:MAG: PorT family protein [Sphingobacteriales bacterium]|nr:MAG: PorT family protein [Sphingobacteriales bacterium]
MKKFAVLSLTFVLLQASAFAQKSHLKIGLETGFGLASFRSTAAFEKLREARPSTLQGIALSWRLSEHWFLRTGASLSLNGSRLRNSVTLTDENGNPIGTYKAASNLPYLNVPLLAGISFGNRTRFYGQAGPYVGFLLAAHDTYDGHNATDQKALYKSTDFGIMAGAGVEVPLNKRFGFTVELRDQLGLSDISTPASGVGYPPLRNNAVHLLIGVNYRF